MRARSRTSALLVAARMITPLFDAKPSISVSNWLSVFSRSSLAPMLGLLPLARPMASISSIKTMQGAFSLAFLNRSRTRLAPTPTNISTKSEPDMLKKGTLASPATALASNVLPVPGGPIKRAPLGILPPSSVYLSGFFRKSTISSTSCLASFSPATSSKVTVIFDSLSNIFARDLPTLKMFAPPPPPPWPLMRRKINIHIKTNNSMGHIMLKKSPIRFDLSCASMSKEMLFSSCAFISSWSKESSERYFTENWGPVVGGFVKDPEKRSLYLSMASSFKVISATPSFRIFTIFLMSPLGSILFLNTL